MSIQKYGIHWFRRDLRVAGNNALRQNFKAHNGRVLCLFAFDKEFLSRDDFSINRFQFFLDSLSKLKKELKSVGGDLITLDVGPDDAFKSLLSNLKKKGLNKPSLITWGRDYEPFARERDSRIKDLFKKEGVDVQDYRDHLLIEPHELYRNKPDESYQIYTPFSKKWLKIFQETDFKKRVQSQKKGFDYFAKKPNNIFNLEGLDPVINEVPKDCLKEYSDKNSKKVTVPIPKAGFDEAIKKLKEFKEKIEDYKDQRDLPSLEATSGLSVFLKNGSITISQIIYYLNLKPYEKKETAQDVYFSELIWREFYYHVLFRKPSVETEEFNSKYKDLDWENNKKFFERWKEGETGFPIVDAGMRQLKTTGLMHNRLRMIVASFLTKDLLIDWRWGEKYFMQVLLDGDMAPNNGGWQWAASTGCDAQPYFRIFNPFLQSKRFDPKGEYIKKFVPELKDVDAKKLHAPILDHKSYPAPVVDHKERREQAIDMYKTSG